MKKNKVVPWKYISPEKKRGMELLRKWCIEKFKNYNNNDTRPWRQNIDVISNILRQQTYSPEDGTYLNIVRKQYLTEKYPNHAL